MSETPRGVDAKRRLAKVDGQAFLQMAFLSSVFILLLNAWLLHTSSHEASALDGLYLPMLGVIITFVLLYMSNISLSRFVANSILFTAALSILMAAKYEFFKGGDVNYMYRLIDAVANASTFNAAFELPSGLVGIYRSFPGFVFLNVIFIKLTGLTAIEGYKFLFPIVFGLLYPASFFLLSGIVTSSDLVRKAIVMAAVIPYALLPGAPWNYFMMPNYFAFLLFLVALHLVLRKSAHKSFLSFMLILILVLVTMITTHPLASLYTAIVFTSFLLARPILARLNSPWPNSVLSSPLVVFAWIASIGWAVYSSRVEPYFQSVVPVALLAFLEGFKVPTVTERLETAGLTVFLITHLSKLMLGGLAIVGIVGLLKRRIPKTKLSYPVVAASALMFAIGAVFFVAGYALYDIFVGYRSLFLNMTVLTLAAGLGLATLSVLTASVSRFRRAFQLRRVMLGILLVLILALSLFELYPTEYVNPTVANSVHTIYQRHTIGFLNSYWVYSSQILLDVPTYQVVQSFGSVAIFNDLIRPDEVGFHRIQDQFTTIIGGNAVVRSGSNVIYNSGVVMVNSTLR